MSAFPFETWRYRHIEGLGSDIELQFVDRSYTGEYKLALDPEEKDALLYIPGAGLMEAERMGLATRAMRPYFDPSSNYPKYGRQKDGPFDRFWLWNRIHHPPALKYPELREVVEVDLSYGRLPFSVRLDYFRLNETKVLAVISVAAQNKDLNWIDERGAKVAKVAVYGIVTGMTQEVISEFDDDLIHRFNSSDFQSAVNSNSLYQKILPLDANRRYKLSLVVKDMNVNNPFKPEENISAGIKHFKGLMDSFNGDYKKALSAYNAGKEAVIKHNGVPDYKETRDYIEKVIKNYLKNK